MCRLPLLMAPRLRNASIRAKPSNSKPFFAAALRVPPQSPVSVSSAKLGGGSSPVLTAVASACPVVGDADLPAAYAGSLYDCADTADALRALT